jgi:hypothetical protein
LAVVQDAEAAERVQREKNEKGRNVFDVAPLILLNRS